MITIRLLGGARKAVGRPSVDLDRPCTSIHDILTYLKGICVEPRLLQPDNLLIAVNGVESSALQGENTPVRNGDIVMIVTVVHGGA